jgi:hypothetical protein
MDVGDDSAVDEGSGVSNLADDGVTFSDAGFLCLDEFGANLTF